jgi:hypothetical protein
MRSAINIWTMDQADGKYPTADADATTGIGKAMSAGGITWTGSKDGYGESVTYAVYTTDRDAYILYSKGKDKTLGGGDDIYCTSTSEPIVGTLTIPSGMTETSS